MASRYAGRMDASLDHDARLARLEAAAPEMGAAFGIAARRVRRLPSVTRAVFALEGEEGRFVLRVHGDDESREHIESLLRWLRALAEGGLPVPRPLCAGLGDMLPEQVVAGLPGRQRCSLLTWLEGATLTPQELTPDHLRAMGELLAHLHDFAACWRTPPGFARPRLDADGLFGERSAGAEADEACFSAELREAMRHVERQTRALMRRLDATPAAQGLIHGDLIAKNCLFRDDGVCALDFDGCGHGYFLYDLAPAMLQVSALTRRRALADALWTGYTTRRPLPEARRAELEVFVAARLAASCRWLAAHRHVPAVCARMADLLAQRTLTLRDYLATGRVRRRSAML